MCTGGRERKKEKKKGGNEDKKVRKKDIRNDKEGRKGDRNMKERTNRDG